MPNGLLWTLLALLHVAAMLVCGMEAASISAGVTLLAGAVWHLFSLAEAEPVSPRTRRYPS